MTTSYMPLEYFSRALVLSCNLDEITIFKGEKKKKKKGLALKKFTVHIGKGQRVWFFFPQFLQEKG